MHLIIYPFRQIAEKILPVSVVNQQKDNVKRLSKYIWGDQLPEIRLTGRSIHLTNHGSNFSEDVICEPLFPYIIFQKS